jgi:hypothetical protein
VLSNLTQDVHRLVAAQQSLTESFESAPTEGVRALRQPNRKLRPAEVDEVVHRYEDGMDLTALGAYMGMHRQTVRAHLVRRGIDLRPQWDSLTQDQIAEAIRRYRSESSTYQIGREFNVGPEVVRQGLIRKGIQMRPRGHG